LNPYQVWLRGVPVKWRVLLAMAPFTLLFGLLEVLFHQLGWELWKFDSLTGSLLGSASFILALVMGGSLSRDANHQERRPPRDTLRSASALCTGSNPLGVSSSGH
jgi:hypothetical protein